jgi:stage V sporulation protein SpoVS
VKVGFGAAGCMARLGAVVAVLGLATAVGLVAACTGPTSQAVQARAEARGTAAPTGRLEDWSFSTRPATGGYIYGQRIGG